MGADRLETGCQMETVLLDQFHEQSRRLDAFLNSTSNAESVRGKQRKQRRQDLPERRKNHEGQCELSSGSLGRDTAQRIDALREFLFDLQSIAALNVEQMKNPSGFYSFDKSRAQDELDYRNALKAELDSIGNNVDRLGRLPRSN